MTTIQLITGKEIYIEDGLVDVKNKLNDENIFIKVKEKDSGIHQPKDLLILKQNIIYIKN